MNFIKQCVSLKLALKMEELGFRNKSEFVWVGTDSGKWVILLQRFKDMGDLICHRAYSSAELGDMLPNNLRIRTERGENKWIVTCSGLKSHTHYTRADTEADARALMLIYLKENNLC